MTRKQSVPSFGGNFITAVCAISFVTAIAFGIRSLLGLPSFIPYVVAAVFSLIILRIAGGEGILAPILAIAVVWTGIIMIAGPPSISFERERVLTPELVAFRKSEKWGVMDNNGKVLAKAQWDDIKYHDVGLIAVKQGKEWGIVRNARFYNISYKWDSTSDSSLYDDAIIVRKDGVDYVFDIEGNYRAVE